MAAATTPTTVEVQRHAAWAGVAWCLGGGAAAALGLRLLVRVHQRRTVAPPELTAEALRASPAGLPAARDRSKLRRAAVPAGRQPVVLVACGSFSPPTLMHLRIFEEARTALEGTGRWCVLGGFLSPVHAGYGKPTLAPMHDRLNMARLAVEDSDWLVVDDWECRQSGWTRTYFVLREILRAFEGWAPDGAGAGADKNEDGGTGPVRVMLLCGADLVHSFVESKPDGSPVWASAARDALLEMGVVAIAREGTDLEATIDKHEALRKHRERIVVVRPCCENKISSSAVRQQLQDPHGSVKYLVTDRVAEYLERKDLRSLPQWQP